MTACTTGADLSKTTLGLNEFLHEPGAVGEGGHPAGALNPSQVIGFIDVEGQGDRHLSHEIMLATPLLLLSKVRTSTTIRRGAPYVERRGTRTASLIDLVDIWWSRWVWKVTHRFLFFEVGAHFISSECRKRGA